MTAAGLRRGSRSAILVAALLACAEACRRAASSFDRVTIVGAPAVATDPHRHSHLPTFGALANYYEGLVGLDANAAVVPQLATVWENPSDMVWRLHLRGGVLFHDGRPFGAADVVASLERARRLPGSEVVDAVKSITGVRALDDRTVEITTRRPAATLLAQLAYVPIVPRDAPLSPIVWPVGTGPYRFVRGKPYGTFEGRRFERYWGPKPLFRRFRYVPVENPAEQARWIEDGLADVAAFVPRSFAARPASAAWRVVPGRPVINLLLGMTQWPGPFGDRRCREAVARAIDRNRLVRADPDRLLSPLYRLVPPGVLGSVAAPSGGADPAAARRLLVEAGYPGGLDVSLLVYQGDRPLGREIADELAAAGIRAQLRSLPRREYFQALSDRSGLFLFNWVPEWGDAAQLLDGFLHSRDGAYGEHNYLFNGDGAFDRLIEAADRTLEPSARIVALEQAVRYAQRDFSVVALLLESRPAAVRADLDFAPRSDGVVRAFDLRRRR